MVTSNHAPAPALSAAMRAVSMEGPSRQQQAAWAQTELAAALTAALSGASEARGGLSRMHDSSSSMHDSAPPGCKVGE